MNFHLNILKNLNIFVYNNFYIDMKLAVQLPPNGGLPQAGPHFFCNYICHTVHNQMCKIRWKISKSWSSKSKFCDQRKLIRSINFMELFTRKKFSSNFTIFLFEKMNLVQICDHEDIFIFKL